MLIICHEEIDKFVWSRRKNKYIECSLCIRCWRTSNKKKPTSTNSQGNKSDETSALLIGAIDTVRTEQSCSALANESQVKAVQLDHYIFSSVDGWKK